MTVQALLEQLAKGVVDFTEVMAVIDQNYRFTPSAFRNGEHFNEANTNNGSCPIFACAPLHGPARQQTLTAFGDFYRVDVLASPKGSDHANIRNFMVSGWDGIQFEGVALQPLF